MAVHRFWLPPSPTHFAQFINALQWNDEGFRARYSGADSPLGAGRFLGDRDGVAWKKKILSTSDSFVVDSRFQVHHLPDRSFRNIYKTLAQKVTSGTGEGDIPNALAIDYGFLHEIDWRLTISLDGSQEGGIGQQSMLLREAFRVPAGTEYWFINGFPGDGSTPTAPDGWSLILAGNTTKIRGAGFLIDGTGKHLLMAPPARGETSYVQLRAIPSVDEYIIMANHGLSTPLMVGSEVDWPVGA